MWVLQRLRVPAWPAEEAGERVFHAGHCDGGAQKGPMKMIGLGPTWRLLARVSLPLDSVLIIWGSPPCSSSNGLSWTDM